MSRPPERATEDKKMLEALGETGLDDLELRFVEEYCVDLQPKKAAERAGVPPQLAAATGRRLLRLPEVMQAIDVRLAELSKNSIVNAEWVRSNLKALVERCMQAVPVMEWVKGEDGKKELVPTGEYKFDSSGANKGLETLAKHLGMLTEHSTVTIEHELKSLSADELQKRLNRLKAENKALSLVAGEDGVYAPSEDSGNPETPQ